MSKGRPRGRSHAQHHARSVTSNPTLNDYMVAVTEAQATLGLTDTQLIRQAHLQPYSLARLRRGEFSQWELEKLVRFFESLLDESM